MADTQTGTSDATLEAMSSKLEEMASKLEAKLEEMASKLEAKLEEMASTLESKLEEMASKASPEQTILTHFEDLKTKLGHSLRG